MNYRPTASAANTVAVATAAAELAELREFYDGLAARYSAGDHDACAKAIDCRQLVQELERANDELLQATRSLR